MSGYPDYGEYRIVSAEELHARWYQYWPDVECSESKNGKHEYVNVGFTSEKYVCKHCDTEKK